MSGSATEPDPEPTPASGATDTTVITPAAVETPPAAGVTSGNETPELQGDASANSPGAQPEQPASLLSAAVAPGAPETTDAAEGDDTVKGAGGAEADQGTKVDPTQAKPGDEAGKTETTETAPALEPIVYPEWKFPEGIQGDKATLDQFTSFLGEHRIAPEVGQALLDQHIAALNTYGQHLQNEQHRIWLETRQNWVKQSMADPQIGGAGHQTAMGAIARMRDMLASDSPQGSEQHKKDLAELSQVLDFTGMGDHPVFLKFVHRIARYLDEPALPPPNIQPAPGNGRAPKRLRDIYRQNQEARNG